MRATIIFLTIFLFIQFIKKLYFIFKHRKIRYQAKILKKQFLSDQNLYNWDFLSYVLEIKELDIFTYLLKVKKRKLWHYKSLIQELDVCQTTPLHTAIRLQNPKILSVLLDNILIKSVVDLYETRPFLEGEIFTINPLALALKKEYCSAEIVNLLCNKLPQLKTLNRFKGQELSYNDIMLFGSMCPFQQALAIEKLDVFIVLYKHGFPLTSKTLQDCIKLQWKEGIELHHKNGINNC